jgi:hypothetical protein
MQTPIALLFAPLVLGLAAGCARPIVPVVIDAYPGANVQILAGVHTSQVDVKAPLSANFEGTSLGRRAGYHLLFRLDERTARAFGAARPITIHGELWVNKPTDASKGVTLRVRPTDERLRGLASGKLSEISAYVSDPSTGEQLALLVLRMEPF